MQLQHKITKTLILCSFPLMCQAQNASTAQPAPQAAATAQPAPLATPAITGPLQAAPPSTFGSEATGEYSINGIVSGMGFATGNPVSGDKSTQATLSNGMVFVQKASGWWQFYVQAGAYNIPALGTAYLSTEKAMSEFYGPVPVAFLKLAPAKNTSILIGSLPTLMGAESTFTFQNMNIQRGLLWNQENAVNRGIQVNQTVGKVTASLSWNDGFYSNRYSWLSGALTYANGPHAVAVTAMGNLSQTAFQSLATPVQNNSRMWALIYTYSQGNWIVQPYLQFTDVPTNRKAGVGKGAGTRGVALLTTRKFRRGFSLAGRGEYLNSTGNERDGSVNLMYGPGSSAWSLTVTPTYQYQRFFIRAEVSFVRANAETLGFAFGRSGLDRNQPRGVLEAGFLF